MILAAGLGTRMAHLTAEKPKPLVELKGKALIDYAIDRLVSNGVTFIAINVHYKAEMLIEHLKKRKDVEIRICDEREAILDTGGAIAKALPLFDGAVLHAQFRLTVVEAWARRFRMKGRGIRQHGH
jgi:MurNAc alpha-1-phosphate uridylyltransferase